MRVYKIIFYRSRFFIPAWLFLFFSSLKGFACASCGSGGDDPLVLYPNENIKFYLSISRFGNFKTVDTSGKIGTDGGPQFKDSVTFSVGKALTESAFVTFTLPYLQNWKSDSFKHAWGDPIFAARWSLVQQSFDDHWVPQIQAMAAYKYAHSTAIQESIYPDLLDVFGTGVSETKLGVDVFWGMADWKAGFAHSFYLPGARQFDGVYIEPGIAQRTTAMGGYGVGPRVKILVGLNRDVREQKRLNGKLTPLSQEQNFSLFLTGDWMLDSANTLRISYSRKAATFDNINTSRSEGVTLAAMSAL